MGRSFPNATSGRPLVAFAWAGSRPDAAKTSGFGLFWMMCNAKRSNRRPPLLVALGKGERCVPPPSQSPGSQVCASHALGCSILAWFAGLVTHFGAGEHGLVSRARRIAHPSITDVAVLMRMGCQEGRGMFSGPLAHSKFTRPFPQTGTPLAPTSRPWGWGGAQSPTQASHHSPISTPSPPMTLFIVGIVPTARHGRGFSPPAPPRQQM